MSVLNPVKPNQTREETRRPYSASASVSLRSILPAAALLCAVLGGLRWYGFPLSLSLVWALIFGGLAVLRLEMGEALAVLVSRLCLAAGPLVAYTLVELMNWNQPWSSFSKVQVVLNLAWYYLIAGAVYLIAGRRNLSTCITLTLFFLIGLANRYVIRFRGRTIFPGDLLTLQTAANVAGNYDYSMDTTQVKCLLICALCLLLLWKLPRQRGRSLPRLWLTLPMAGLAVLYTLVFFNTGLLAALEIEPDLWTTRGNGFVLNFTTCLRYSAVEEPAGYSRETLANIVGDVESAPPPAGAGQQPVNVIVIMNESYSDLGAVGDLPVNEDYMPFYRALTENTVKGTAYSSVFGGTTANSEYEFLTGNTMAILPEGTVPFHMFVDDGAPNLGAQMKELGYETVFMHPYRSSGWNRVTVYQDFGFDRVLFQDDFQDTETMRTYITDQSDYENVVRLYEEKEEGEPLFIFNVTMQNHSGYNVPWDGLPRSVQLTGDLAGRYPTVDQYLSLIKQSDLALEYLIDYFSQAEEPTMILLFGDHQPQVTTSFYRDMLGGGEETWDAAASQKRQAVPFLLWANYDIPEAEGLELSINYLSALLMERAGLPQTGYQQFLNGLRQTLPAVNAVGYQDTDGAWARKRSQLSDAAQAAMDRYEALQYNQLFDDENRLEDFFTLPTGTKEAAP